MLKPVPTLSQRMKQAWAQSPTEAGDKLPTPTEATGKWPWGVGEGTSGQKALRQKASVAQRPQGAPCGWSWMNGPERGWGKEVSRSGQCLRVESVGLERSLDLNFRQAENC